MVHLREEALATLPYIGNADVTFDCLLPVLPVGASPGRAP